MVCVVSMSELLSVLILVFLELDKSPISFYLRNQLVPSNNSSSQFRRR